MTSADFLIELAGRLHHERDIAHRLTEIAHELHRLHQFADDLLRDAMRDAREADDAALRARDRATADLNRICMERRR